MRGTGTDLRRIDLHTHSAVSDGTDTPAALVAAAARAGLDVVGLTDHDTFDGIDEALAAAVPAGVQVIPGVEISTQLEGRSVHLLGYGCNRHDAPLLAELERIRRSRDERVPRMCELLTRLGVPITVEEVLAQAGEAPSVGRPHFADVMVAKGYVASRDEAFRRFLADDGPAFVARYATPLRQAIGLVHGAGGVAVLAHPWGRGSRDTLSPVVLAGLAREQGLDGIEVWHQDHDDATRRLLHQLALDLALLPTGSSDYHGTGKVGHPLGVNLTPPASLAELERRMARRGR